MHYDGTIRIQSINNTKSLKEMSQTVNSLYSQSGYEALSIAVRNANKTIIPLYRSSYMKSFSNAVSCLSRNGSMVNYLQNSINTYSNLKSVLSSCLRSVLKDSSLFPSFSVLHKVYKRNLFFYIADNMGFPIYLEVDSELQDMLIESYIENGNQCNKKEMRQIILDYYNDDYVDYIFEGIKNVQIFNLERVILIREGIGTYQLGRCGSSASLFAAQLSGMIRDAYEELS